MKIFSIYTYIFWGGGFTELAICSLFSSYNHNLSKKKSRRALSPKLGIESNIFLFEAYYQASKITCNWCSETITFKAGQRFATSNFRAQTSHCFHVYAAPSSYFGFAQKQTNRKVFILSLVKVIVSAYLSNFSGKFFFLLSEWTMLRDENC